MLNFNIIKFNVFYFQNIICTLGDSNRIITHDKYCYSCTLYHLPKTNCPSFAWPALFVLSNIMIWEEIPGLLCAALMKQLTYSDLFYLDLGFLTYTCFYLFVCPAGSLLANGQIFCKVLNSICSVVSWIFSHGLLLSLQLWCLSFGAPGWL